LTKHIIIGLILGLEKNITPSLLGVDNGAMHESSLTSPTYNLANAAPSESGQMLSVYAWIFSYVL